MRRSGRSPSGAIPAACGDDVAPRPGGVDDDVDGDRRLAAVAGSHATRPAGRRRGQRVDRGIAGGSRRRGRRAPRRRRRAAPATSSGRASGSHTPPAPTAPGRSAGTSANASPASTRRAVGATPVAATPAISSSRGVVAVAPDPQQPRARRSAGGRRTRPAATSRNVRLARARAHTHRGARRSPTASPPTAPSRGVPSSRSASSTTTSWSRGQRPRRGDARRSRRR